MIDKWTCTYGLFYGNKGSKILAGGSIREPKINLNIYLRFLKSHGCEIYPKGIKFEKLNNT